MTSPAPMPGPPCDICGEAPAVLSILNYADWQQLKLCGTDAPQVMRGIADTMDGRQTVEPLPEPGSALLDARAADDQAVTDPPPLTATVTGPPPEGMTVGDLRAELDAQQDDGESGSKADHWASTANVRRSTHGHRTPRKATGTPRKDEPE